MTDTATIYVITRDGEPVDQTEEPMRWFHVNGSQSMEWQLQHEGYAVEGPFTQADLDASERLRHASSYSEHGDEDCDCSHPTRHPVRLCPWDRDESRAE